MLEKRKVTAGFAMDALVVVEQGLAAGDRLVVTSPTIAVPGMNVKPVEDEVRKTALLAEASGKPAGSGGGSGGGGGGGGGKKASGDAQ